MFFTLKALCTKLRAFYVEHIIILREATILPDDTLLAACSFTDRLQLEFHIGVPDLVRLDAEIIQSLPLCGVIEHDHEFRN